MLERAILSKLTLARPRRRLFQMHCFLTLSDVPIPLLPLAGHGFGGRGGIGRNVEILAAVSPTTASSVIKSLSRPTLMYLSSVCLVVCHQGDLSPHAFLLSALRPHSKEKE